MTFGNDQLEVTFRSDAYSGVRFDNTGFITQVVRREGEKSVSYGTVESLIPGFGTGGLGLANEFDGWQKIKDEEEGELVMKIGVGWLKIAPEGIGPFGKGLSILDGGQTVHEFGNDYAKVTWTLPLRSGYGCRLEKHFVVEGEQLIVNYSLENTGENDFRSHEYAHNFINIGDTPVTEENYHLIALWDGEWKDITDYITFGEFPSYKGLFEKDVPTVTGIRGWRLTRRTDGASMEEIVDFAPDKFAVWAQPHVLSCEVFTPFVIAPGETARWTRRYTFKA